MNAPHGVSVTVELLRVGRELRISAAEGLFHGPEIIATEDSSTSEPLFGLAFGVDDVMAPRCSVVVVRHSEALCGLGLVMVPAGWRVTAGVNGTNPTLTIEAPVTRLSFFVRGDFLGCVTHPSRFEEPSATPPPIDPTPLPEGVN